MNYTEINESILPDKFTVNIDTVEFSAKCPKFEMPDVANIMLTNKNGEIEFFKTNRVPIAGKSKHHPLHIRFKSYQGTNVGDLFVEGSPVAYRFGQNVFTSSSMKAVCISTLRHLNQLLGIQASDEMIECWKAGDIELHRVDLAVNFKLDSDELVDEVIKQLKRQIVESDHRGVLAARYVAYAPQNGQKYSVNAYNKGAQLKLKTSGDHDDEQFQRLLAHCEGVLRIEVRLRHQELVTLGLSLVRDWKPDTPRIVFKKYFARLPSLNVTSGTLSASDLDEVDGSNRRAALALHMHGVPLKQVYSQRTMARIKADFRQQGIDLNCPHQPKSAVSIAASLSKEGVIMKTPKWLRDAGMALPLKPKVPC